MKPPLEKTKQVGRIFWLLYDGVIILKPKKYKFFTVMTDYLSHPGRPCRLNLDEHITDTTVKLQCVLCNETFELHVDVEELRRPNMKKPVFICFGLHECLWTSFFFYPKFGFLIICVPKFNITPLDIAAWLFFCLKSVLVLTTRLREYARQVEFFFSFPFHFMFRYTASAGCSSFPPAHLVPYFTAVSFCFHLCRSKNSTM